MSLLLFDLVSMNFSVLDGLVGFSAVGLVAFSGVGLVAFSAVGLVGFSGVEGSFFSFSSNSASNCSEDISSFGLDGKLA